MKKQSYDAEVENPILNTCLEQAHNLLCQAWGDFVKVRDKAGGKGKLALAFSVDCEGTAPIVGGKLRFSDKFASSIEVTVDLAQETFPFLKDLSAS